MTPLLAYLLAVVIVAALPILIAVIWQGIDGSRPNWGNLKYLVIYTGLAVFVGVAIYAALLLEASK